MSKPNTHPTACTLTKDELTELVLDHGWPLPAHGFIPVRLRLPYDTRPSTFYVPASELEQARASSAASKASDSGESTAKMPATSAGVAPGSMDSAMQRAVIKRSYTKTAARPASVLPLRSMMRNRASKASTWLFVVTTGLRHSKATAYKSGGLV